MSYRCIYWIIVQIERLYLNNKRYYLTYYLASLF